MILDGEGIEEGMEENNPICTTGFVGHIESPEAP